MPDAQFYKDVGTRLYDLIAGGVQDVFTPPARWSDPNWTLRGMEADAWKNNPVGEFNRVMAGPIGLAPMNLTVYHGSPHKFSQFDASKIGTGEGAQAYGHGLYLADQPSVAKNYMPKAQVVYNSPMHGGKNAVMIGNETVSIHDTADAANKALGRTKAGNLYKVDLPDEMIPKMLDWDKPLSQQPESVRRALANAPFEIKGIGDISGRDLLEMAHGYAGAGNGGMPGTNTQGGAELLRSLGIPGIRYLDQGSRSSGKGTYNYVVFPGEEKALKILGRE